MRTQKAGVWIGVWLTLAPSYAQRANAEVQPELLTPSIEWWSLDAGAAVMSGGSYELTGSLGQTDASAARSAGGYELTGGFWPAHQQNGSLPLPDLIFKNGLEN